MDKTLTRSMVSLLSTSQQPGRVDDGVGGSGAQGDAPTHQRELGHLMDLWEGYQRAQRPGTVVVIHGTQAQSTEALIKDWRRQLMQRGEQVFAVSCRGGSTYGALRDVVSSYAGHLDDLGLLSEEARVLFDELSVCLGLSGLSRPETMVNVGAAQPGQVYFYELLGRFFVEASRLKPAVVVLGNLHLADASSLAAITYLSENFALDPIDEFIPEGVSREGFRGVVVLTLESEAESPEGEGGSEVLSGLRAALEKRPHAEFIDLRGVDEETVRQYLVRPEVVSRVLSVTAGSEANLEALLGMLPEDGETLFRWRFERLTSAQKRLLETLAVYGRPMSPTVMSSLTPEVDGAAASEALSALQASGVLTRRVRFGALELNFTQEVAARFVRRAMDAQRRAELHGRLARLLQERRRFGQHVDVEEIAEHLLASEQRSEAIEVALSAAEGLHATYAYERARDLLQSVLPLLPPGPRLESVYERLIDMSASLHDHKQALFYCGRLKKLRSGAGLASVYRLIGRILLGMGKYDLAVRSLAKALYRAGHSDDQSELVRILGHTAEALYGQGQYDEAVEVCHKGLERALHADGSAEIQRLVIDLTNTLGKVNLFREDYAQAREHFRSNSRLAEAGGWPAEKARALFNLGTIAVQQRDYKRAEEIFLRCLSFGHTTANVLVRASVLLNLAVIYQQTLRFSEALDCYLHALAAFKKSGSDLQFAVTAMNLADAYEALGDLPKARALIEASLELTEAREIRYFHARSCNVRGRIALKERQPAVAVEFFKRAREGLTASGPTLQSRLALYVARAYHDLGQRAERDRWTARVQISPETAEGRELCGDHALFVSRTLADEGSFKEAEPHAREAHGIFEDEALMEKLWLASTLLGRICRGQGRIEEAKQHVAAACAQVEKLSAFVPEPLRGKYLADHERKQLHRLSRALEAGDPFEEREMAEASQEAERAEAEAQSEERGLVVRVGQRPGRAFARWRSRYGSIVGEDPRLHHLFRMIDKVAGSDSTLLLIGESGTGKELFAEAIHTHSSRRDGPLIKVNCAAFVETLLLSELFGHEKGAFTGALSRKKGRFEMADGGTIFLDEIGDISSNTQVALLRVLQERSFERVGGNGPISVDVRVVAATNRNLEEMVRQGTFRLDLYYRLKGVMLELPPLRERRGDIALLVRHFTDYFRGDDGEARYFSHDALRLLSAYNWPGNIRELENFVRSMLLFVDEQVIDVEHIREFDEFFATGEMSAEQPRLVFEEGWWTPQKVSGAGAASAARGLASEPIENETVVVGTEGAVVVEGEVAADHVLTASEHASGGFGGDLSSVEPSVVRALVEGGAEQALVEEVVTRGLSIQDLKKRLELECIKRALVETDGNITHAANILKMKRPRLSQIINAHDELGELKRQLSD